jgi:hypothetical protein
VSKGPYRDFVISSGRDVMTSQEKSINTAIPDLQNIPVDRLAELGSSVLAHAIALYRERLKENGIPLSSFNARI